MEPMLIAQIEPPQNIEGGDFCYRNYAPGVCLAREEGVYVINLASKHRLSARKAITTKIPVTPARKFFPNAPF